MQQAARLKCLIISPPKQNPCRVTACTAGFDREKGTHSHVQEKGSRLTVIERSRSQLLCD
eukprot:6204924-Pleurochrysis_carterae.AAC.3